MRLSPSALLHNKDVSTIFITQYSGEVSFFCKNSDELMTIQSERGSLFYDS